MGRVAIGKKKGGFVAGSIVMFAVDDTGIILKGMCLSGVTVLARFKEFNDFNGVDIATITQDQVKSYSKQVQKSILDASHNYITITGGGTIEEAKSPIQKLTNSIQKVATEK